MPRPRSKNVFLTGASSGIGRATAELLVQRGHQVWGTSRRPDRLAARAGFHPIRMSLDEAASIDEAWRESLRQAGHFDVVVQNAGSGIVGAIEDVSLQDAHDLWQVLVHGPLQILRLAAAHLRPRRAGLMVGVSSLAAELPMPFAAHYSASKSALSALLGALAMELQPFGVRVVDLRPGDIHTSFNDELPKRFAEDSPYFPWAGQAWREAVRLMVEAPAPELVSRRILRLVEGSTNPGVSRVGSFFQATLGPLGVRLLPTRALLHSIRRYYGLHQVDERERPRT